MIVEQVLDETLQAVRVLFEDVGNLDLTLGHTPGDFVRQQFDTLA